jgi:hypothetical protein
MVSPGVTAIWRGLLKQRKPREKTQAFLCIHVAVIGEKFKQQNLIRKLSVNL